MENGFVAKLVETYYSAQFCSGVGAIFPESAQLAAGVRAPPFTSHVVISLTSRCDAKREWHVCSERSKAH